MKPRFTVIFNFEDPTNPQIFNAEAKYFPDLLYAQTGFELEIRCKEYSTWSADPATTPHVVGALDLTGFSSSNLYIKPKNSVIAPTSITTGALLGPATDGIIEFDVDKDVVSNSLANYTNESNPTPIVLYFVAETSNGKITLETDIRIMDINRDGTEEVSVPDASQLTYTPEQSAKWTGSYWGAPSDIAAALDKLARLDHTDRGSVLNSLATPPGSPADADAYLVIATGTGAWVGKEDSIMEWNAALGSWLEHAPREGDELYEKTANIRYRYNGSAWVDPISSFATLPVNDTTSLVQDPGDNTKQMRIDAGAITTATTRVLTMPDQDIDLTPGTGSFATEAEGALAATAMQDLVNDTTPQAGGDISMNSNMMQWSKGADVASASALALGTDGNSFDITGTTTITSINTVAIGTLVVLQFDGALTLTHHATDLILPGAANITTAAGDIAIMYEYATGDWRCVSYQVAATAPGGGGGGAGGGILPSAVEDKTGNFTVTTTEAGKRVTLTSSATADSTFTLGANDLADETEQISFKNESSYKLTIDMESTNTINNNAGNYVIWKGDPVLTISGDDGSTNVDIVAGG